ncbi:MAG TPA: hypothetical protein VGH74_13370, partial [Planctomycetaceae bacterium]
MIRWAGPIGAFPALCDEALEAELAGLGEQSRIDFSVFELSNEDTLRPAHQQPREIVLAEMQRQMAPILAIGGHEVEGVKLDFAIVLPRMQPVEIRDTFYAQQHCLAVDHERARSVPQRGLDDQRISIGPVLAVLRE